MNLNFYTPSFCNADGFGGATFGFAGAEDESHPLCKGFPEDIKGIALSGTYQEVLESIPQGSFQAAIVLLGNGGDENTFIRALREKVKAPLVGGSGAICPKTGKSALIHGGNQAAVFLVNDDRFDVTVICENAHRDVLSHHAITFDGRYITAIDDEEAVSWYNQKRKSLGLSADDFEHLTFSDTDGINAHLSIRDGRLFSGRDLSGEMLLRYLPKELAQARIQNFYDDENAIIFGCAGLKQTLTAGIKTKSLGLFMFGEVCSTEHHSDFGNLMLSKIKFIKK